MHWRLQIDTLHTCIFLNCAIFPDLTACFAISVKKEAKLPMTILYIHVTPSKNDLIQQQNEQKDEFQYMSLKINSPQQL